MSQEFRRKERESVTQQWTRKEKVLVRNEKRKKKCESGMRR